MFQDVQCDDDLDIDTFVLRVAEVIPTPPSRGSSKDNIEVLLVRRADAPLPADPPSAEEIKNALKESGPITNVQPESRFVPGAYFCAREKRPSLLSVSILSKCAHGPGLAPSCTGIALPWHHLLRTLLLPIAPCSMGGRARVEIRCAEQAQGHLRARDFCRRPRRAFREARDFPLPSMSDPRA